MRIDRLMGLMEHEGCDLALITHMVDLYYFTGTIQPGFLAVAPGREPLLLIRKAYQRAEEEVTAGIRLRPLPSPKDLPAVLADEGFPTPKTLGLELDVLPYLVARRTSRLFPDAELQDVGGLERRLRAIKDEEELTHIRGAGEVWTVAMETVRTGFKPMMDEYDLALLVEAKARRAGHQGLVRTRALDFEIFIGHLLSGPHGAIPSRFDGPTGGPGVHPVLGQGAAHRTILPGEPVLADYASAKEGYVYDGTRTFVEGRLPERLQTAYEVVEEIHARFQEAARAGEGIGEVVGEAFDRARKAGLEENFMGFGPDRVRFLGHGIGLELDELPVLLESERGLFEENMVVAVEPKFVFPGLGAVGLENTYRVTRHGAEPLVLYEEGVIPLAPQVAAL